MRNSLLLRTTSLSRWDLQVLAYTSIPYSSWGYTKVKCKHWKHWRTRLVKRQYKTILNVILTGDYVGQYWMPGHHTNNYWSHEYQLLGSCQYAQYEQYINTRHRASTCMYSLTFCVCVVSPECHHWKPAVQAAAVMLRTPPSTASQRSASHAHFPYTARNFENAPVTRSSARKPRRAFALCRHIAHIAGWTQACN